MKRSNNEVRKNCSAQIWECLGKHQQPVSTMELAAETGLKKPYVSHILNKLFQQKYVSKHKVQKNTYWQQIEAANPSFNRAKRQVTTIRKKKTGRQKMWNSMKINGVFTMTDLMMCAEVKRANAVEYLQKLVAAGYVKALTRGKKLKRTSHQGRQQTRYRLLHDTGRFTPIIRKDGVWDQNQQKHHSYMSDNKENSHEPANRHVA